MKPNLFALTVILTATIHLPTTCSQRTKPYKVCGQLVQCGNTTLHYPFWGLTRPVYCGHPGFKITCKHNVTILRDKSLSFRVLKINTSHRTITIARNDLWSSYCPQYLHNTTYDSNLFNDNNFDQEDVTLFYGCDSTSNFLSSHSFGCGVNDTKNNSYVIGTKMINVDNMINDSMKCNTQITVPVMQSLAKRLAETTDEVSDLRSTLKAGFNLEWTANDDECDQCVQSGGRCGSNLQRSTFFACYFANESFSLACDDENQDTSEGCNGAVENNFYRKWKLVTGVSCGITGIMVLLFVIVLYRGNRLMKTQKAANHQIEMFIRSYGTLGPKRFKYSEIKKMTNSFLEKLGQGGYGSVYKGQLPNGRLVAVKLLAGAQGDGEDFINEVASISKTSHINIVTLLGFCIEGKKRALLYEFMPNGSLDKFLRGDGSHLDWNTLFQIAKGIARGLEYLHRGCNTRIVHFDIKPHNILLDEEFVPKISDFGLAKLCKRKESIVSVIGVRGTAGYMAPEVFCRSLGGASHKSDVYSYGMMVLEMAGSHKHNSCSSTSTSENYFPDRIYEQVDDEEEEELARKMMIVSLWCIQSDPSDRPSIDKVVEMLEGSFESLQVPTRRFESSSTRLFRDFSSSNSQTKVEL
ncbi:LEAF RUST 10 DISEASE-RESISTANCE LOCUS RECEPTOR-LIKE PROTEIN KINASE-like 2.4 [Bidens hawaiensis]|uniref:LEAF RUST 10 DISEASE-RESISTANCE LOCUS RECEPTOR-LIKE PROTEIN KINASE-like 2.4 n=1 Tax=Bidens hawaiensis TaxID=980011 RepID=UPI0040493C45